MKSPSVAAVALVTAALCAAPAAARESCGEIWKDHVLSEKDMASFERHIKSNVYEHDKLNRDLATLQKRRRELRCIDDPADREVLQRCREIDKYYVAYSQRRDDYARWIAEERAAQEEKRVRSYQALERFKKRCTCWTAGEPHTGMSGRNLVGFRAADLDDCKLRCNQTSGCLSIDYNATNRTCYLNDLDRRSRSPVPTFTTRPTWPFTYYERCS